MPEATWSGPLCWLGRRAASENRRFLSHILKHVIHIEDYYAAAPPWVPRGHRARRRARPPRDPGPHPPRGADRQRLRHARAPRTQEDGGLVRRPALEGTRRPPPRARPP